jgi:hypothetical protein
MVETVLFRDGVLSSWWFTDKVQGVGCRVKGEVFG